MKFKFTSLSSAEENSINNYTGEKSGEYYVVPNTPSLIYRNVSQDLSKILSENIFSEDCSRFLSFKS